MPSTKTPKPTAAQAKAHTKAKARKEAELLARVAAQAKGSPAGDAAERELAAKLDPTTASTDPVERVKLAQAEHKLLQAWIKDGSKPPKPATPNLDAVNADHAARGGKPRTTKRTTTGGKVKPEPQPAPKADKGTAVIALRNAGHGELVAKALADAQPETLAHGAHVDGAYLLVPKTDAQPVMDALLHALDAKGLGQFTKRQLVLATLLVRHAYPKVTDPRTNPVAKLVTALASSGQPWSVGWAADSTPTFTVSDVTYATAKAAAAGIGVKEAAA